MLAELFDRIITLGDERRKFDTLLLPGGRALLVRRPDGSVVAHEVPPQERNFATGDLQSFVDLLGKNSNVSVFVPHDFSANEPSTIHVIGFFDRDDRREQVRLDVELSQALLAVYDLAAPTPQKRVIELLRDSLIGCCDPGLLTMMRALDFTRRNDGSATIDHGKESLGVSVEASVRSRRGELPEVIELDLPLFADEPFSAIRRKVNVAVEIDASNQRLRFAPRADQLHVAYRSGIEFIVHEIINAFGDEAVQVVIGTP